MELRVTNWKLSSVLRSLSKFCGVNWINSLIRGLEIKLRNKNSSTLEASNFFSILTQVTQVTV